MSVSLSANLSLLYASRPVRERFALARAAGFDDVESWWPFAAAVPEASEIDDFLAALRESGVALRALNFYGGDLPAGERGILSHPNRVEEFLQNVDVVEHIARETGCRFFNALYGQRLPGVDATVQDDTAVENLVFAARRLGEIGGTVLLEALKSPDNGDYPLRTLRDADAVRHRVRSDAGNVALLFDTFHLAGNGADLDTELREFAAVIGHVQLADFPGRGAPGTGEIDFPRLMATLHEIDYAGFVAAEFLPHDSDPTRASIEAALGTAH